MRTIYILFAFTFFITSCDNPKKEYYYPNGKIHYVDYFDGKNRLIKRKRFSFEKNAVTNLSYYDNELLNAKTYYHENLVADYKKYKNGYVKAKIYSDSEVDYGIGKIDSLGRQVGWWTFFDRSREIVQKRYFLIYRYDIMSTQIISYEKGKIDSLNSQLANLSIKKQDSLYKGTLTYSRMLNNKSYVSVIVSSDINSNFTNDKEVVFDTIGFKDKTLMEFPIVFETKGKKTLKGYIIEQYLNNDEMNEVRTPFEKNVIIK
jgi:hypothetical protein